MSDAFPVATRSRARWIFTALFVALVAAPLVAVTAISSLLITPGGTVLEIELRATGGTAAQIFWTSNWAFSPEESSALPLHQHPGQFERLRFPLPSRPLLFIRFDPLNGPGEVLIRSMRVMDRDGKVVRTIDPILLAALHQIEGIMPAGPASQDVRVVTTKDANDPMLLMKSVWLTAAPTWRSAQIVTPFSLAWISLACLGLIATALVVWEFGGMAGVTLLSQSILAKDGREKLQWMQEYVRNVRHYVVTGELAPFLEKRGPFEVPYFSPMMLAGWLSHPYIRHILPASVRAPLVIDTERTTGTFGQTASHKDLVSVWDSYAGGRAKGQGRFESKPIECGEYDQVRFEVAGAVRGRGMQLFLQPAAGGRETPLRTPLFGGAGWTAISVRCPSGPFRVVAVDESSTAWFAFRQPAEIGWASSTAEAMIQQSWAFGVAALILTLLAAAAPDVRRRNAED